jgi:hypothetical protein
MIDCTPEAANLVAGSQLPQVQSARQNAFRERQDAAPRQGEVSHLETDTPYVVRAARDCRSGCCRGRFLSPIRGRRRIILVNLERQTATRRQAALRNASTRLSHWLIWFQLANVWLTTRTSILRVSGSDALTPKTSVSITFADASAADGVRFIVELQRAADHVKGPAELGLPESIAQDRDVLAAWRVLPRPKDASEGRPNADDLEEARADGSRLYRPCGARAA